MIQTGNKPFGGSGDSAFHPDLLAQLLQQYGTQQPLAPAPSGIPTLNPPNIGGNQDSSWKFPQSGLTGPGGMLNPGDNNGLISTTGGPFQNQTPPPTWQPPVQGNGGPAFLGPPIHVGGEPPTPFGNPDTLPGNPPPNFQPPPWAQWQNVMHRNGRAHWRGEFQ